MHVAALISGGAPLIKSYQVAQTTIAGIPVFAPVTGQAGVFRIATAATGAIQAVGVTVDAATYSTTQGTGASSAEALNRVVVNPDAICKARLSGNNSSGTAMAVATMTTANAGGVTLTDTASDFTTNEMVDGVAWGITGANVGQARTITATGTTTATLAVPFDYAIAVGDTFCYHPYGYCGPIEATNEIQFTDDELEVRGQGLAVDADAQQYAVIDMELNGVSDSYVHIVSRDHVFANSQS